MPINLLKLPSLVGAMVVTELDYQEIFLLTLCSRRSLSLVKKARITVPKLTFRLEKCDAYDSFVIGVKIAIRLFGKFLPFLALDTFNVKKVKPMSDKLEVMTSVINDCLPMLH
ncbi:unnamed protein product [Caenorhabditis nigoni]